MNVEINPEVKFPKNVLLIDIAVLNREAVKFRRVMSSGLKRKLPLLDMYEWITCVALDGKVMKYGDEIQVIFILDSPEAQVVVAAEPKLVQCDGMTFMNPVVGDFTVSSVHPAGFTDTPSLFFDLMHILLDCKDVENLMLIPSDELYGSSVRDELDNIARENGDEAVSKVCLFSAEAPSGPAPYRQEIVIMSMAHVFGIKPDEVC